MQICCVKKYWIYKEINVNLALENLWTLHKQGKMYYVRQYKIINNNFI